MNKPKPYSLRKKASPKPKSTHSFGKLEIPKDAAIKPVINHEQTGTW